MLKLGDHGGETENEVSSALFVYSMMPLAAPQNTKSTKQVNLVPILATVLGVPIPFSNLGSILHEALPILKHTSIPQWKFSLYSHWSNVEQIMEYLKHYSKVSNVFENERLKKIYKKFNSLKVKVHSIDEKTIDHFHHVLGEFIGEIRGMCEEVWVEFDSFSISRGLLLLFLSLFFIFIIWDGVPRNYMKELFLSPFLLCSYVACFVVMIFVTVLYYFDFVAHWISAVFFGTGVVSQFMLAMLIVQNWDTISLNWHAKSRNNHVTTSISRLILTFTLVCLFSNSYIQEEASMLLFLLSTVSLLGIFGFLITFKEKQSKWTRYKFVFFSVIVTILLRLSVYFWRCREEQDSCSYEVSSQISKESTKSILTLALASMALFIIIGKTWMRNCGSLNGYSLSATLAKYAPTVMVVSIGGYWIFHKIPSDSKSRLIWKGDHLVWFVYFSTFFGILFTFIQPLLVYILPRKSNINIENDNNIIPNLFKKLKGLIEEKERHAREIPIIYGLGTVYSSVYIIIGVYLTIVFGLILGEAEAPSAAIMFLTAAFMLVLTSTWRIERASTIDDLFEVPNLSILLWVITSHYFFYATGHQPAWSNIDWNAAFIGASGIFANNFVQGTLVILNTFCPFIIMGFLLPMMIIAPFTLLVMTPSILRRHKEFHKDNVNQGELLLFENSENLFTAVLVACCKYLSCHGLRVFASMLAATIHCRHLMVWKIFAPKFIFESVSMCVTLVAVLFGYIVLVRISSRLEVFLNNLNKQSS